MPSPFDCSRQAVKELTGNFDKHLDSLAPHDIGFGDMAWIWVILAGFLEVGWALGLKASHGLTRPLVSVTTVFGMLLSFVFLAQGMKQLPVGTAYTIWTGIGAVGSVVFGILFFGESRSAARLLCLALTVIGMLGLKFFGEDHP